MADGAGKITLVSGTYLNINLSSMVGRSLSELEASYGRPLKIIAQPSQKYFIHSGTKVDGSYYIRNVGLDKTGCVNSLV